MTAMSIRRRVARASPAAERADMDRRLALLEDTLGVRTQNIHPSAPIGVANFDRLLITARLKYLEKSLSVHLRRGNRL